MAVEYAPKGLIGLLTPQANTTVEPEHNLLMPPGFAHLNGRMMSDKGTIQARLADYVDQLPQAVRQFANAPIQALGVGTTGASYVVGREREDRVLAELAHGSGVPAYTAATAVLAMLERLGARRVALASPYPDGLNRLCTAYWESRGLTVVRVATAETDASQFHPIYAMSAQAAEALLTGLGEGAEAVVMLGTGMPTLAPVLAANQRAGVPVLSCMLALAWRGVDLIQPGGADPRPWLTGAHWAHRLREHMGWSAN